MICTPLRLFSALHRIGNKKPFATGVCFNSSTIENTRFLLNVDKPLQNTTVSNRFAPNRGVCLENFTTFQGSTKTERKTPVASVAFGSGKTAVKLHPARPTRDSRVHTKRGERGNAAPCAASYFNVRLPTPEVGHKKTILKLPYRSGQNRGVEGERFTGRM